jgi:replicative DNA helicase
MPITVDHSVQGPPQAVQKPLNRHSLAPRAAHDVLIEMHQKTVDGRAVSARPVPLGFDPLDKLLGGGIRPGDLMLIGGAPGAGKTTFALQAGRSIAAGGQATCLYLCYEHDEDYLATRLVSLESTGSRPGVGFERNGLGYAETRQLVVNSGQSQGGLWQVFAGHPNLVAALERIERYGSRLLLQKASGIRTDVAAINDLVRELRRTSASPLVVVVDFLQKVPSFPETEDEGQRVTRIVQGLKDLALSTEVGIIAIVAAEKESLDGRRLRAHHFRGSSALVYEADVILVFNSKYNIITKTSIEYNLHKAQDFHNWVVCTLEKNRSGRDLLDLEFRKRFEYACFDPQGAIVEDKLIGDRVTT